MNLRKLLVCALAFVLLSGIPLFSQAITAKVVGTVTDPSGAVIPGAKVTIRNVQTNQARTGTTDELGNYEFSFLPVGAYSLSVEAVGFQKSEVRQFTLNVDQVARMDVRMVVGQATQTVEVQAGAVLMQTEDATVGTVIDSQKVVELPLNGRSFVQLALLTPGVNPGTPGSITVRRLLPGFLAFAGYGSEARSCRGPVSAAHAQVIFHRSGSGSRVCRPELAKYRVQIPCPKAVSRRMKKLQVVYNQSVGPAGLEPATR